jgi:hypothetical protein
MSDYIELRVVLSKPDFESTGLDEDAVVRSVRVALEAPMFYALRPVVEVVNRSDANVKPTDTCLDNILMTFGALSTAGFLMYADANSLDTDFGSPARFPVKLLNAWWYDTYTTTEKTITEGYGADIFEKFALWNANLYSIYNGERRYSKSKFAEWHNTIHLGMDEF